MGWLILSAVVFVAAFVLNGWAGRRNGVIRMPGRIGFYDQEAS